MAQTKQGGHVTRSAGWCAWVRVTWPPCAVSEPPARRASAWHQSSGLRGEVEALGALEERRQDLVERLAQLRDVVAAARDHGALGVEAALEHVADRVQRGVVRAR